MGATMKDIGKKTTRMDTEYTFMIMEIYILAHLKKAIFMEKDT